MATSLTVIVLIPIIMITTEKACSIFFSISFYTIFFLNMTCLLDIYFGILPTPHQKSNGPSLIIKGYCTRLSHVKW